MPEPEPEPPDPGADPVDEHSRYQPKTGYRVGLYNAENVFQKLNRYLMLWNIAHLWNKASCFILNRYRHHNIVCVCRAPSQAPIIIHSKEGIAQGCDMAIRANGIALLPLCRRMNEELTGVPKPWYADDALSIGTAADNAQCLAFLVQNGPWYGYFPQPGKSCMSTRPRMRALQGRNFGKWAFPSGCLAACVAVLAREVGYEPDNSLFAADLGCSKSTHQTHSTIAPNQMATTVKGPSRMPVAKPIT